LLEHPNADDEPLLHSATETLATGEARAEARRVADQLRREGVEPRHAVAVQLRNGPHAITTMFGVWLAGAVFVPVNPRYPERERDAVVAATRPAALVTEEGIRPAADPRAYDDGVAFVTWTSGTTGAPKPVLHTHANYLELIDRVLQPLRGRADRDPHRRPKPNLVPVSLALNAGIYNVCFGLRAGAEVVVMDEFDTREFAALVRRFGIASTVLPPAAMTMLNDDPAVTDLTPLRFVRSITAPLSPLQARRFAERFGVVVLNSYGQAEIGEVVGWTAADARDHPEKLGAAGRPHPGVDLVLADVDPQTGVGRLLVRPPSTAVGIDPARVDAAGHVDTGDLARIDDDGFVWIEGRAGDVINRGGNKVFPEQVEEVLRLAPAVADAAVVGVADDRLGEVPVAFVITTAPIEDDELRAVCREHLAPYKVPVAFHRVDAFPRSDVGKVLRRELARGLAAPGS
jgi:acyl-CoA synthetase (AMP-forming)/AMP-acid ligase II